MDRLQVEILALREILSYKTSIRDSVSKYASFLNKEDFSTVILRLRNILKYIYRISYRVQSVIGKIDEDNSDLFYLLIVMYREIVLDITESEFDDLVRRASEISLSYKNSLSEERMREILVELRNKKHFEQNMNDRSLTSVLSNVPPFLVDRYFKKYDPIKANKMFTSLSKDADTYVVLNLRKIDVDSFLRDNEGRYEFVRDNVLRYISKEPLKNTVEYKIGRITPLNVGYISLLEEIETFYKCNSLYVDEEAKFDIGGLIKLKLDENEGILHSYYGVTNYEKSARDRALRIGAKNIDITADKLKLLITYHPYNNFDLVVLNERSSSFGLMKRNKIVGITLTKDELKAHRKRETEDLFEISKYVSLGGDLVYFVNSFLDEETKDVTKKFLSEHEEFSLVEERIFYPSDDENSDGSYYAIMRRG